MVNFVKKKYANTDWTTSMYAMQRWTYTQLLDQGSESERKKKWTFHERHVYIFHALMSISHVFFSIGISVLIVPLLHCLFSVYYFPFALFTFDARARNTIFKPCGIWMRERQVYFNNCMCLCVMPITLKRVYLSLALCV